MRMRGQTCLPGRTWCLFAPFVPLVGAWPEWPLDRAHACTAPPRQPPAAVV